MKKILFATLVLASIGSANAAVNISDKNQWGVDISGYVEPDMILDSTRSFVEAPGNTPVARPEVLNGQNKRLQFSVRNSRLGFAINAPEYEGWKSKGYYEFDLGGFDPAPGSTNNEGGFFNNPTIRVRHIYMNAEKDGWTFMAGQYWDALGFQPIYFIPTVEPAPVPGMLYGRTTQFRATKSFELAHETGMQAMVSVQRPPQRDASYPDLQGGARLILDSRSAGFTGGATGAQKTQPMSFAVTGALRQFEIPSNTTIPDGNETHYPGMAVAVDGLIPVIASSDGKDVSNTLMLGGEFTTGKGYGDQFAGYTGNLPNPTNSVGASPEKNINLDGGLGGFDPFGNFSLVNLRTFNAYLQYHLPVQTHTWFSGGYGSVYSSNIGTMTGNGANANKTAAGVVPYTKDRVYFANVMRDLTKQIRVGFEYAQIRTNYEDVVETRNTRLQLSAFFIF